MALIKHKIYTNKKNNKYTCTLSIWNLWLVVYVYYDNKVCGSMHFNSPTIPNFEWQPERTSVSASVKAECERMAERILRRYLSKNAIAVAKTRSPKNFERGSVKRKKRSNPAF